MLYSILCFIFVDGREFIPSVWNGSYVCSDNNLNISYVVNLTKSSDVNFGVQGVMMIENHRLAVQGTFAWFQQVLALQHQIFVADLIYGNDFTNIEIDMNLITTKYMKGALVFTTSNGLKTCTSEMRRTAGSFCAIFHSHTISIYHSHFISIYNSLSISIYHSHSISLYHSCYIYLLYKV